MFFTFPDEAVEFWVEIGEYRGVVRVPAPVAGDTHPRTLR